MLGRELECRVIGMMMCSVGKSMFGARHSILGWSILELKIQKKKKEQEDDQLE
jgi:hypothetical protein